MATETKLILETIVKGTETSRKKLKSVSASLKWIAASAKDSIKVIWALWLAAWWLALKEFAAFEKQMSKVKAITNATEEEFQKLNKLAKKMGATTAFTAKEAWDAFEFLWMAGLSVKEAMDALPWSLELAAAWNLSLADAADIATNIMAQYWIKAKDIWRVNDVLAKSATSANTSVWEMAEAMKFLWPVANAIKIPLEEWAAAIDVLANNGIKGSMAWQAFATSLLRISKPTTAMSVAMKEANTNFFDTNWQFIGLAGTIKQLEAWMVNFTDKQKLATISTIFWAKASKQWLTLVKEGSGELIRYTTELENSWWAAKKMAEIQLDNLSWSFTLLKSAVSWAMIEIGWSMDNELRPKIDELTESLTKNQEKVKEFWESFSIVIKWVIFSIWFLVQSWFNLWRAIWFVTADIVIKLTALWNGVKKIAISLWNTLKEVASIISTAWTNIWTNLEFVWWQIKDKFNELVENAKTWWSNLIEMFIDWLTEKVAAMKEAVIWIATTIKNYLWFGSPTDEWPNKDSDKWIPNLINMLIDWFKKGKSWMEDAVEDFSDSIWKTLAGKLKEQIEEIKETFTSLSDSAISAFDRIKSAITWQKTKISWLVDEYKKLKKSVEDIDLDIKWIQTTWATDIATRAVEIQNELEWDITAEKILQLQEELKLAKTQVTANDIAKARVELEKSQTQKIIDRINIRVAEAETEKKRIQELMTLKRAEIEDEMKKHKEMIDEKKRLDTAYFDFFGKKIQEEVASVNMLIRRMRQLMSMVWWWNSWSFLTSDISWARAKWWPVQKNKTFLVWEEWPELFSPNQNWQIIPNNKLGSNGWSNINITISGIFGTDAVDEIWDQLVGRLKWTVFI